MIELSLEFSGFRLIYFLIALLMWSVSLLFSKEYFAHYDHKLRYYGFMILTLIATLGVFVSSDFMTTFIFFEVMSVSSYVWVAQEETKEALKAGTTYLVIAIIGGMVMLMGLFLLYDAVGTLRMDLLKNAVEAVWEEKSRQIYVAGFCMLFGFGAKAGMFPLHFWLPKAHPVAPAPASALLSGILTKCGIFGIIILTAEVFVENHLWGMVLLTLGTITMVAGAVLAVFSINLKRTLACSSVSQIGFILVGIAFACLLGEHNTLVVKGTFLHMVNHSLIKLVLFNCAGVVYMNLHELDLNDIRGFGRKKPFLMVSFLMGALGIGGIPLWNGYVSKTLLHESIVEYVHHVQGLGESVALFQAVEWTFLISGGLTVAYMLKLFVCLFIEKHPDRQEEYDNLTNYMNTLSKCVIGLAAMILPVIGIFFGIKMNLFTWINLKGGFISIGIGILLYILMIRKIFIRQENGNKIYRDLWPYTIDVEKWFEKIVKVLINGLGWLCEIIDKLPDRLAAVFWSDSVYGFKNILKNVDFIPDSGMKYIGENVFAEITEPEEKVFTNMLHKKLDKKVEIGRIICSSFSFGLLLACIGLLFTIVYLLIS